MFERLSRSWSLLKASAGILRQDKQLVVFPLVSAVAMLVVFASFAVPVVGLGVLDGMSGGNDKGISAAMYVVAFLFYFAHYLVIFFFNTALVGAAMIRLDGGAPTLGDGVRIATSRFGAIVGYALIAATVGMVLRVIEERVGFIGKIIVGLLGIGWTIATYLVVPVLAARQVGPIDAVKESATLLKKTWGENVIGQAGLGLAFGFILFGMILVGGVLVIGAAMTQNVYLIVTVLAAVIIAIGIAILVQGALTGIYAAALYRYASGGQMTEGFDGNAIKLAFAPKK
jgi:Family of unknown function (DUF6159)